MTPTPPPTLPGLDPAPLPLAAACELLTVADPAGWQRCPNPGAPTRVGGRQRAVCPGHRRQLPGLAAAGLLGRLRFAVAPTSPKEGPDAPCHQPRHPRRRGRV